MFLKHDIVITAWGVIGEVLKVRGGYAREYPQAQYYITSAYRYTAIRNEDGWVSEANLSRPTDLQILAYKLGGADCP